MKRINTFLTVLAFFVMVPGFTAATTDWALVEIPKSITGRENMATVPSFSDISVDNQGNLYLLDNPRMIRFTPEGLWDRSWGDHGIIYDKDIDPQNTEILWIKADNRGYVYAVCRICIDGSPCFIKRYAPDGQVDTSWYGDGVMGGRIDEDTVKADEAEVLTDGIAYIDGINLDIQNNLYVIKDQKVYRYLPDGGLDADWTATSYKQPLPEFEGPWYSNRLVIDWQNNVLMFNGFDKTLSKYNSSGNFIEKRDASSLYYYCDDEWGVQGVLKALTIDQDGCIITVNPDSEDTLSKYNDDLQLITSWGTEGILQIPNDLSNRTVISSMEIDGSGDLYFFDATRCVVSKFNGHGQPIKTWGVNGQLGNINSDGNTLLNISDNISNDDQSIFFQSYLDDDGTFTYCVSKTDSGFSSTTFLDEDAFKNTFGYSMNYNLKLAAYEKSLFVLVETFGLKRVVLKSDATGKRVSNWIIANDHRYFRDILTDGRGYIYLEDSENQIWCYTPTAQVNTEWGRKGCIGGEYKNKFGSISDIAFDLAGNLYICDQNAFLYRYNSDGQLDLTWGIDGKSKLPATELDSHGYYFEYAITLDKSGNLYCADTANNRIIRFNATGQIDSNWCKNGIWQSSQNEAEDLMPLISPSSLMVFEDRLYVVWNNKMYVMNDAIAQIGMEPNVTTEPSISNGTEPIVTTESSISNGSETNSSESSPIGQWIAFGVGILILFCAGVVALLVVKKKISLPSKSTSPKK